MAKKAKEKKRERAERRFLPHSTTSPLLVKITGALGAAAIGAGLTGQYARPDAVPYAWWVLAAGALLMAAALWIGTTGDAALRVGDGGVAVEKGGLRRMPWWAIESVAWDEASELLVVNGKDEAGGSLGLRIAHKSQPQAVAWIVKEARARIPKVLEVSDEARASLPKASRQAGEVLKLDATQVVGRRCAQTDKSIAWESDARLCPRCERVYHKDHVPGSCACGGSLAALQKQEVEAIA